MLCIHGFILAENTPFMANYMQTIHIQRLHAFSDNYIWLLHNNKQALVVDPGQAQGVLNFLKTHNLTLTTILITHHHGDHTGGIKELTEQYQPSVYAPLAENICGVTHALTPHSSIHIEDLDLHFDILNFSGHTLGHIGYYTQGILFCGDTLFSGGCGRIFEGTPESMFAALQSIKVLPQDTLVYCAHEYTQNNLQFALAVEPHNPQLQAYAKQVERLREECEATIPTSIERELAINPFLRTDQQSLIKALTSRFPTLNPHPLCLFAFLRSWKNSYPSPPSLCL